MIKLMYITNDKNIAKIVEHAGVERVFVDMEYIGKDLRQGGKDTVQNHHTIEDVKAIKDCLTSAEVLVRCNPIHEATEAFSSSKEEIDAIIEAGADIIMLPYFKTADEAKDFVRFVGGRAKTLLLVETPEAVAGIDEILAVEGIDEIFIGLNDLSLGYGMKFMFELLADGTVENLCNKFKAKGIPYGFGGIASIGKGLLPADNIIPEHYRLGSKTVILSRSFCDINLMTNIDEIREVFEEGIKKIRDYERMCEEKKIDFSLNRRILWERVKEIKARMAK